MSSNRHRTALVTGASGGIGMEIARQLAGQGANLVLVARSAEKLEQLATELRALQITVHTIPADLSAPAGANDIVTVLTAKSLQIDILVNNAGVGDSGFFHSADLNKQLGMIQLNISSLVALTHQLIPPMVGRQYGRILNVASTAAFQPGPLMSVYYATKAFVLSFSRAIGNELGGTGVTVTALCPGPVETGFQAAAGIQKTRIVRSSLVQPVSRVAKAGLDALERGQAVVVPGLMNKLMVFGVRLLPGSWVVRVARFYQSFTK